MLVKPKKGKCLSCKKEAWKLSHCHGNITFALMCVFHKVDYWCQVSVTMPLYFRRYFWFCDLSSHCNHWWCHHLFSLNLNISRMRENITKKKTICFFILKGLSNNLRDGPLFFWRGGWKFFQDKQFCANNFFPAASSCKQFFLCVCYYYYYYYYCYYYYLFFFMSLSDFIEQCRSV